jgi:hypothetical protein
MPGCIFKTSAGATKFKKCTDFKNISHLKLFTDLYPCRRSVGGRSLDTNGFDDKGIETMSLAVLREGLFAKFVLQEDLLPAVFVTSSLFFRIND